MGDIKAALAACDASETPNYTKIAKEYSVHRTTLSRHHRGIQTTRAEATTQSRSALSKDQQLELISYINKLSERGFPPANATVRFMAEEIAGRQLGKNWVTRFIVTNRSILASIFLEGIDASRQDADSISSFKHWFELVSFYLLYNFCTNFIIGNYKNWGV
jgi:hypothetical protein